MSADKFAPIPGMQLPFSDITLYTRPLTANQTTFTETFSGLSPSTSAILVALRTDTHALNQDRERYLLGGSGTGIKSLQCTAGQFVAPQPSYNLHCPQRLAARAMSDFVDFVCVRIDDWRTSVRRLRTEASWFASGDRDRRQARCRPRRRSESTRRGLRDT